EAHGEHGPLGLDPAGGVGPAAGPPPSPPRGERHDRQEDGEGGETERGPPDSLAVALPPPELRAAPAAVEGLRRQRRGGRLGGRGLRRRGRELLLLTLRRVERGGAGPRARGRLEPGPAQSVD